LVERTLESLGLPTHDRDSATYVDEIRPLEYEALMAAAHENAECGAGVIVTAPFVREFSDHGWLEREKARFADEGVPAVVVLLSCDAPTMHTYIRRRGAARDGAKLADWSAYLAKIDPDSRPVGEHYVIDNAADAEPLSAQAKRLVEALSKSTDRQSK
jgi:predicted kinase